MIPISCPSVSDFEYPISVDIWVSYGARSSFTAASPSRLDRSFSSPRRVTVIRASLPCM